MKRNQRHTKPDYFLESIMNFNKNQIFRIYTVIFKNIFIVLIIITILGCEQHPDVPLDFDLENAVFAQAEYLIEIHSPAFNDTTSATPAFTWKATQQNLVFLGIFKENIAVKENIIVNINDNIWAWHSGLGKGREGNVKYTDGFDVLNGVLEIDSPPTPLINGQSYVWAVWAWDNEGLKITHSSQEMFFTVIGQSY